MIEATNSFTSPNLAIDGKFLKLAFDAPDLLGKVLRTHIEIESQMDKLVLAHSGVEFEERTEFAVKCLVLEVMGWPASQLKTIRRFGTLRNKFAHRKPEGKTHQQIEALRDLIVSEHGMEMVDDVDRFTFGFDSDASVKVSELSADEKLVVVGSMLAFLLGSAPDTHSFTKLTATFNFEAAGK